MRINTLHLLTSLIMPWYSRLTFNSGNCLRGSSVSHFLRVITTDHNQLTTKQLWITRRTFRPATLLTPVRAMSKAAGSKPRGKFVYECGECHEQHPQWVGKCPSCGAWNALQKVAVLPDPPASESSAKGGIGAVAKALSSSVPIPLSERDFEKPSRGTWIRSNAGPQSLAKVGRERKHRPQRFVLHGALGEEVGRVLGGGVVPGSLILVGGDPGVGKSTLMLQVAALLCELSEAAAKDLNNASVTPVSTGNGAEGNGVDSGNGDSSMGPAPVLYVSGEESMDQVAGRAERMGKAHLENLLLYSQTNMDEILNAIVKFKPFAMVVDSIQTVYLATVSGSAGSVSQVRECAQALLHIAKQEGVAIFLVGHVTKSGEIAGPRVLEHVVDVVLYLEGERQHAYRLLRGMKNRFGATDEVGVFEMKQEGLFAVHNPSALFLGQRVEHSSASSSVTVVMEGSRPVMLEIQALTVTLGKNSTYGPRRVPTGVPMNRMSFVIAVLTKHAQLKLYKRDVYTNVVGGITLSETASDLAVAVSISSSYYDQPVAGDVVVVGEVGLGGEVRPVGHLEKRLMEAKKLGFRHAIIPRSNNFHVVPERWAGMTITPCAMVTDALKAALGTLPMKPMAAPKSGNATEDEEEEEEDDEEPPW